MPFRDNHLGDAAIGRIVLRVKLTGGATRVDTVHARACIPAHLLDETAKINLIPVVPGRDQRAPDAVQRMPGQLWNSRSTFFAGM